MLRFWCLLALMMLGCGSALSDAVQELEAGRPAHADYRFRALAPELPELDRAERTRYALYRGLNHLTLGDAKQADRWLSLAKRDSDRDLSLLSTAERGRLLVAWRSMGRMPGDD